MGAHEAPINGLGVGSGFEGPTIAHCGLGYGLGAWARLWAILRSR